MQSIISISGLSKTYASGFAALKGVDLDIRRGEIFALLGPNGAGKTTTIRILLGLAQADGGSASVLGTDVLADPQQAAPQVGFLPDVQKYQRQSQYQHPYHVLF